MTAPIPAALSAADSRVRLQLDGSVARVTLNRPESLNALDVATSRVLIAVVEDLVPRVRAGSVRAVLLRANGRSFCAGGDITGFVGPAEQRAEVLRSMIPPLNAALHTLAELPVPVVSAVNGAVGGGGIGLALGADLVVAAQSMVLRGGYTGIGLSPDVGSSWFVTRLRTPPDSPMSTTFQLFAPRPSTVRTRCTTSTVRRSHCRLASAWPSRRYGA